MLASMKGDLLISELRSEITLVKIKTYARYLQQGAIETTFPKIYFGFVIP